jgi:T5SS/PEP-CTERM-associated repeat protein
VSPGNALEFADPSTSPELPQSALEVLGGSQVTIDTPQDFGGLLIGDGGNGSGRVLVRDEQSSIDLTGDNFQLSVGQFGTGQLVVKDGGSVTAEDGFHPIGNAAGSNGTVVVSGRASRFETPGTVAVAQGFFDDQGDDEPSNDFGVPDATTTGRLTVSNQANVQAGELLVGSEPNSEGNVLVEGIGDVEVGGFTVGVEGAGNMTIRDGGTVGSTGSFNAIANAAGSTGAVMVDGSGSELGAQGSFTIGNGVFDDQGDTDPSNDFGQQGAVTNASMTVSNSAKVSTSGDSTGIIVGSEAMVDGSVASLTVASGGTLETPNLQGRGPNSAITITGSGTQVNVSSAFGVPFPDFAPEGGFLRAARNDGENGEINVLNGADVTVSASEGTSGPGIQIARQPGSNGSMMIDGQNTSVEVIQTTPTIEGANFGPYLQAGRSGAGDVQVRNGATLLVEGPQSSIVISQGNADEFADPGNAPALEQSRLLVADGGEVTLRDPDPFDTGSISGLEVGNRENGNGLLRVDGNGSIVSIEGEQEPFMNVGDEGQGVLEAFDGGVVSGMFLSFGAAPTGNGTGVVSGTESAISLAGKTGDLGTNPGQAAFMQVGRSGTGELTVENGGKITISGENEGVYPGFSVGFNESSQGTMTVTDSQSNVTVLGGTDTGFGSAGIIYVGRGGTGDLTVSDGGTITNSDDGIMMVGRSATSAGTLTVTGTDSSLDVGQRLFVGSDVDFDTGDPLPDQGGAGDVVVEAGGRLEAGDAQNDGIADIVVGAGSTLEIENGGTLLGDVRVVGGAFDLADGATHDGDLIS